MFTHPQFDPVAFAIGPVAIRWYGLMYLIAFASFYALGRYRIKTQPHQGMSYQGLDDLLFFGALGVIVGGRLGFVLFYKPLFYFANPMEILAVWKGGMSFHGGFLGVLVAIWWFSRKHRLTWLQVTDFVAPLVPLGLAAGRLGNFINAEMPGRIIQDLSSVPFAIWYPSVDRVPTPRHPSQLYQMFAEGILLFIILWFYSRKPRPLGAVSALFLLGYGTLRFADEFFREPDPFFGVEVLALTMGQILCLPMITIGAVWLVLIYRKAAPGGPA